MEGTAIRFLSAPAPLQRRLRRAAGELPEFRGRSIRVSTREELTVSRGKLRFGASVGVAVSAASYLVKRRIVLDRDLLSDGAELRRILVHEIFHFVWRRLGNQTRDEYHLLLLEECRRRARGELGWSAEWRKNELSADDPESKSLRWRQYACESFCDTAAWYFGSPHPEHTLAESHRAKRKVWFEELCARAPLSV